MANVIRMPLALRQLDHRVLDLGVVELAQKVMNEIEPGPFFFRPPEPPTRAPRDVRTFEHRFLGLRIGLSASPRFHVHRAELPLLQRVVDAAQKPQMLFLSSRIPERTSIRSNSGTERKNSRRRLRCKAHHALDPGAVVPAAIEQHDLAACGQVRHVALEIPLGALAIARCWQRDGTAHAWIESLGDALDGAALAGRVATLEHNDHLLPAGHDPVLELDQFGLQLEQLPEIKLSPVLLRFKRGNARCVTKLPTPGGYGGLGPPAPGGCGGVRELPAAA